MILFFSGTGNSLKVTMCLQELLHEKALNMECGKHVELAEDESLGIVMPVYAWGLPRIVERYLKEVKADGHYVWTVMTCGDDMGYADRRLKKALGRGADACFSVQMPNTYVSLPGFKVDDDALATKKVDDTMGRLPDIASRIEKREACSDLHRGGMAWMKTYVLRPLFNAVLVTDKYFKTSKECKACGLCASKCPMQDIVVKDGHPQWKRQDCTGCLRCFHSCPKRAIDWGRFTKDKKQKTYPRISQKN